MLTLVSKDSVKISDHFDVLCVLIACMVLEIINQMSKNQKSSLIVWNTVFPAASVQLCITFRPQALLLQIGRVHFLVLLPLLLFSSTLMTWYPRMTPDTEKEHGTAVAVAVAISHYQRCLGHIANVCLSFYINGDRQQ